MEAGTPWRSDGYVRYRTVADGRVGIIPRTCKRRRHDLWATGYTARVHRGAQQRPPRSEDHLVIGCNACDRTFDVDYAWTLVLYGPPPARVEMDDAPYRDARPHFVAPATGAPSSRVSGRSSS